MAGDEVVKDRTEEAAESARAAMTLESLRPESLESLERGMGTQAARARRSFAGETEEWGGSHPTATAQSKKSRILGGAGEG